MSECCKGVLLIVDDEPLKRATLQSELSEAGYTVLEATEGSSALQQIKSRPVDVVVTDLRMPEVDGLRLLEEVKTTSPGTHVILMTAYGSIDSAVEAMKRGAADYLVKPFQTRLLLEKLDWLRRNGQWTNWQDSGQCTNGQDDVHGRARSGACRVDVPSWGDRGEVRGTLPDAAIMPPPEAGEVGRGLTETIAGVERSLIDAALRRAAGNQAKAAQLLGIPRTTLRDKMAKHGMVGGNAAKGQPA